ncbi:hypothetical protein PILCRDRAFT_829918 [Piloderma croceum F 1598]|uniref:Uncharacterized protein n=1 Tax=Piloderma croceum (strain F 1598) TaxID=765440 RepID=A0A0C3EHW0_PILCF|nr:hypothetical protein PILCRDRAFT_829918 [Piloderma croceum F 1598]
MVAKYAYMDLNALRYNNTRDTPHTTSCLKYKYCRYSTVPPVSMQEQISVPSFNHLLVIDSFEL